MQDLRRKLTDRQIEDINREYASGVTSMRQLAFKHSVGVQTIKYHLKKGVGVRPWVGRCALDVKQGEQLALQSSIGVLQKRLAELEQERQNVLKTISVKEQMLTLLETL